ncbi:MAG: S41 family peptidase [Pseudomonadota bacterium]
MKLLPLALTLCLLPLSPAALGARENDASGSGAALPRNQELAPTQVREDLALARKTLEALHAGYDRYTDRATLDGYWSKLEQKAQSGLTRGELYLGISELLAAIRCDHTKAELPKDMEQSRRETPTYLPFRYVFFDQQMWVTQAGAGVSLAPGDEILSIDDRPAAELLARVSALFPVDGDTDYIKAHSVSQFGEFMGPAFEHFMPFVYPIEATARLKVRRADGTLTTLTVTRLNFDDYSAITGEKRFSSNFADAVRFETLGDDAAYLAVDTFVNYRKPVRPDRLYGPIFKQLKKEKRTKLIVDLRRNGGGSDDAAWGLFRWLIREPVQPRAEIWTRMDRIDPAIRPHLSTWEAKALDPDPDWFEALDNGYFKVVSRKAGAPGKALKPRRGAFDGELVMLTSYDNASGVTHLLSSLRGVHRATFIGEPTGGAATGATAGVLVFLTLPHSQIRVRVPLQRTVISNAERLDPRGGIQPDVEALATLDSVLTGADPALAAAKRYLKISAR